MNTRRLNKLKNLLREDAANPEGIKFDLKEWATPKKKEEPEMSCGTTACACGLAAVAGIIPGLRLEKEQSIWNPDRTYYNLVYDAIGFMEEGLAAAAAAFDITYKTAEFLFIDTYYKAGFSKKAKGELEVAQRIEDLVASKGDLSKAIEKASERKTIANANILGYR